MSNQLPLFHPPLTRTDRQLLALQAKAKKYPSVKPVIRKIKDNRRRSEWLSQ